MEYWSDNSDCYGYNFCDPDDEEEENGIELALEKLNIGHKKKKLLVLSLNGFLIHRAHCANKSEVGRYRSGDGFYGNQIIICKRPYLEEFMKFCLDRFEVGIWSSEQEQNLDSILDCAFKGQQKRLLFVYDQRKCSDYGYKSLENKRKPLFFKELAVVWRSLGSSRRVGQFSESNTLLIDHQPYKGLLNPPNTAIFPVAYDPNVIDDILLDPKGELGQYLKGLADAEDVPSYVKEHPLGQPAIAPDHPDWGFYSNILRRVKD